MMYDLKNAKKDAAEDKRELNETGGGKYYTPKLTEHGAAILALMGDQAEPLQNNFDDDANFHSLNLRNQDLSSNESTSSELELENNNNLADVAQFNENDNEVSKENESTSSNLAISGKKDNSTNNKRKFIRKKNLRHNVRSRTKKNSNEDYKLCYYKTKYETALIEKRTALVNLRIARLNLRDKLSHNVEYIICNNNE